VLVDTELFAQYPVVPSHGRLSPGLSPPLERAV